MTNLEIATESDGSFHDSSFYLQKTIGVWPGLPVHQSNGATHDFNGIDHCWSHTTACVKVGELIFRVTELGPMGMTHHQHLFIFCDPLLKVFLNHVALGMTLCRRRGVSKTNQVEIAPHEAREKLGKGPQVVT